MPKARRKKPGCRIYPPARAVRPQSRLPGRIMWLPKQEQLQYDLTIDDGCYNHPVVILSPYPQDEDVIVLLITSLNGRALQDCRWTVDIRASHLPIHPCDPHPDSSKLLRLEANRELKKKSLACSFSAASYKELLESAHFEPPMSSPSGLGPKQPAGLGPSQLNNPGQDPAGYPVLPQTHASSSQQVQQATRDRPISTTFTYSYVAAARPIQYARVELHTPHVPARNQYSVFEANPPDSVDLERQIRFNAAVAQVRSYGAIRQAGVNGTAIELTPFPHSSSFYQDESSQSVRDGFARSQGTPSSSASKSAMSYRSHDSRDASSISSSYAPSTLPALQTKGGLDNDGLEPLTEEEFDPASFDLVVPAHALGKQYTLEAQSELLFSTKHLEVIFEDPVLLQRFSNFLSTARPDSLPVLAYYLDTLKALKAIEYANALTGSLKSVGGLDFTEDPVTATVNHALRSRARDAFQVMANHDLPAYITHTFIQTVSITIKRRITDTLPPQLRDLSEGLAEVFCLSDPSRPDNPIVFASEEFHRTTQYGMNYAIGRNCRFLQGPKTNPFSVRRIRDKIEAGQEHCETFLNYRRDGSPFVNLLMIAPLFDSRGVVRYHMGAQVDVSGLVKECSGLDSLSRLQQRENPEQHPGEAALAPGSTPAAPSHDRDEFRDLAEMFSLAELKTVRESGGALHRTHQEDVRDADSVRANWNKPRLLIHDDATVHRRLSDPILQQPAASSTHRGGRLSGIFQHYLLVRPYPNLRILFASPSLRVPGMLQSPFLSRIGGSDRVRDSLTHAFAGGHGLTAKVRWLSRSDMQAAARGHGEGGGQPPPASAEGRSRWIHCTPLIGSNGSVGVWMVVLVDDDAELAFRAARREAPPVQPYLTPRHGMAEGDEDAMSLSSFAAAHRGILE
ncbi:hypothetical protein AK830_g4042 [Neonectria ditissima]|uniref:PAS domain-containing protein n=1 Tax=Neonectria ditissima TaxID=78410 RepID=A0A0P7B9Y2_9HYPO|nr:hypothetical protein AK830_g4042 [Neonectria ditissima]